MPQRVEAKDYRDVAAPIGAGIGVARGLPAALLLASRAMAAGDACGSPDHQPAVVGKVDGGSIQHASAQIHHLFN